MDFGQMHRFSVTQNSNIDPAINSSVVLLELQPDMGYDRFRELLTKSIISLNTYEMGVQIYEI